MVVGEVEVDVAPEVEVDADVDSVVTAATPPQAATSKDNPNKPISAFFITIPYASSIAPSSLNGRFGQCPIWLVWPL